MTTEEKAKRYDEAIEKAKKVKDNPFAGYDGTDLISSLFPELKESEDERIRKELIFYLRYQHSISENFEDIGKWIAWLEKQGEQKPTNKIEPKFHEGDWVVISTAKGDKVVQIASIEYFKDGYPSYITTEGRWFGNGTKARLLTDKDVDITTIPESKAVVNKIKYWSEEDTRLLNNCISLIDIIDCTEEEQNWLKSLKNRVGCEVNCTTTNEWSKEDEYYRNIILYCLNNESVGKTDKENAISWLKSLKPQYRWKPSDKQMKAIEHICNGNYNVDLDILDSIYRDFKKLREE